MQLSRIGRIDVDVVMCAVHSSLEYNTPVDKDKINEEEREKYVILHKLENNRSSGKS